MIKQDKRGEKKMDAKKTTVEIKINTPFSYAEMREVIKKYVKTTKANVNFNIKIKFDW